MYTKLPALVENCALRMLLVFWTRLSLIYQFRSQA